MILTQSTSELHAGFIAQFDVEDGRPDGRTVEREGLIDRPHRRRIETVLTQESPHSDPDILRVVSQ